MKRRQFYLLAALAAIIGITLVSACDRVSGENSPPKAFNQSVTTPIDIPISIKLKAKDPDDQKLTYSVDTQPAHGTLTGNPPNLTYSPDAAYLGADSFTFHANDGYDDSNIATVNITVSDLYFVDADAIGSGTGRSWEDAFTVVQDAMDAAIEELPISTSELVTSTSEIVISTSEECLCTNEAMIWVAEGTYTRPAGAATTESVLKMGPCVKIYGGFIGIEKDLSKRGDPADHPTVLDGENTSYHVVIGASGALLDGFTVTGGNAVIPDMWECIESPTFDCLGGGMSNRFLSDLIVSNCIFTNNTACHGGGMHNYRSSTIVTNCIFQENEAFDYGAGMKNTWISSPKITNCVFTNNYAHTKGGGIYNYGNTPIITNCTFIENSTDLSGGGIYNYEAHPIITNCIFERNSALWGGGGGVSASHSSLPYVINSTFYGNTAEKGGGIEIHAGSVLNITNCILWGNEATTGSEIALMGNSDILNIEYSNIQGGQASTYACIDCSLNWGNGMINADPLFVPAVDDFHLQPGSPAIDAGDPDPAYDDPDATRNDMGAFGGPGAIP